VNGYSMLYFFILYVHCCTDYDSITHFFDYAVMDFVYSFIFSTLYLCFIGLMLFNFA